MTLVRVTQYDQQQELNYFFQNDMHKQNKSEIFEKEYDTINRKKNVPIKLDAQPFTIYFPQYYEEEQYK